MDFSAVSRRDFLTGSTAALAALGTSKLAFAQGEIGGVRLGFPAAVTPTVENLPSLNWGVIGTGARARAHLTALGQTAGQTIVAAADVDETRLQQAVREIGHPVQTYRDYQQLLANPAVQAVVIATPNFLHREMLEAALAAGKHVLCEKPLASTPEDAQAVRRLALNAKTTVQFGLQLRYALRYQELAKLVASGKIGAPRFLFLAEFRGDWNKNVWRYTDPKTGRAVNWRYAQKPSGGTLNEKCCHYFDILDWLAGGTPVSVSGGGGLSFYKDRETWDHASVVLNYANGVQATMGLCLFGPNRLDLQIIGEEGSLRVPTGDGPALLEKVGSKTVETISFTQEVGHGERGPETGVETALLRLYQDMLQSIRDGRQPLVDAQVAYESSKIAFLGDLAQAQGREVSWNAI